MKSYADPIVLKISVWLVGAVWAFVLEFYIVIWFLRFDFLFAEEVALEEKP